MSSEGRSHRHRHAPFAFAAPFVLVLSLAASAHAAIITPDTFSDDATANGNCTLREAVGAANMNVAVDVCAPGSGPDTIELAAGTYVLSLPGAGEDAALTGDLDINDDLAVFGQGSAQTIIDGGAVDGVFQNDALGGGAAPVSTISDVTIRNGSNPTAFEGGGITNSFLGKLALTRSAVTDSVATCPGPLCFTAGGILNTGQAELTVEQSTISGNDVNCAGALCFTAGGILNLNDGQVTITDTTVDGNTVAGEFSAGGLANLNAGVMSVERSTVSGNSATDTTNDVSAGGINNLNSGTLTVRNSTISGNAVALGGGGIHNQNLATVSLRSSTVASNSAGTLGGGLYEATVPAAPADPPTFSVQGSIVAENTAAGAPHNCTIGGGSPGLRSDGHNLEDLNTCGFAATGDLANATPGLGPLADNGGPTQTHLLAIASAAIDTGTADGLGTDQRGLPRTADFPQIPDGAGDGTDIGAVELQTAPCRGQTVPRIDGTGGDDALTGTEAADAILALAGNDTASAAGGDDCVEGGEGDDSASGGAGNDDLLGGDNDDNVSGDEGNDNLFGDEGKDRLAGDEGKDRVSGGGGKDRLKGGPGKDKLKPGGGKDRINCGGGKDKVNANRKDKVSKNCEKVV